MTLAGTRRPPTVAGAHAEPSGWPRQRPPRAATSSGPLPVQPHSQRLAAGRGPAGRPPGQGGPAWRALRAPAAPSGTCRNLQREWRRPRRAARKWTVSPLALPGARRGPSAVCEKRGCGGVEASRAADAARKQKPAAGRLIRGLGLGCRHSILVLR